MATDTATRTGLTRSLPTGQGRSISREALNLGYAATAAKERAAGGSRLSRPGTISYNGTTTTAPATGLSRQPPVGTITRNGVTTTVPLGQAAPRVGTMVRNGVTTTVPLAPLTPAATPATSPAVTATPAPATQTPPAGAVPAAVQPPPSPVPLTTAVPRTESSNPLSNDTAKPAQPVNAGAAMGFSQRGTTTPSGQDTAPVGQHVGGSGPYARRFTNPTSASIYDSYVKRLFGGSGVGTEDAGA